MYITVLTPTYLMQRCDGMVEWGKRGLSTGGAGTGAKSMI